MRFHVRLAVLCAAFALLAAPVTAGATGIPRVGEQLRVLGAPETFPANEPFHIAHGFGVEGASDPSVSAIPDYEFVLLVDGQEVHGAKDVTVGDGEWQSITWVFNFSDGLSAGEHRFEGVWVSPDGPDFVRNPTVLFVAGCEA